MSERAKHRLVGAVILISLAAIFLPMLFDGAGVTRRPVPELPPAPAASDTEPVPLDPASGDWDFVREAENVRQTEGDDFARVMPEHVPEEDAAQTPAEPALRPAGPPRAWAVQLASFESADNAQDLQSTLREAGYESYISVVSTDAGERHRVAVGPRLDPAAAQRLRDELAGAFELEGMVVEFRVGLDDGRGGSPVGTPDAGG